MNAELLIIGLCCALLALGVLWLSLELRKIKAVNHVLAAQIESINKDIAGLCSAAVKVDSRISVGAEQMTDLLEKLSDYEHKETESSP